MEETPSKVPLNIESRYNTNKSSIQKVSRLDLEKVILVNQSPADQPLHIEDDFISVPFSVIKLAMAEGLARSIMEFGQEIFSKHEKEGVFGWRLHRKGYYIANLGTRLYAVMTSSTYYEGELIEVNSQILPHSEGILFSEKGMYSGAFERGKASGKGQFRELESKATYKGTWKEGGMVEGSIENSAFKYEGQFQNLLAHGKGKIAFKETSTTYSGRFEEGVFCDTKGFLESRHYIYEGGFVEGRKEGLGCLVEKELPQRDKKQKYRPPEQFEGKWHHDSFEGRLSITAKK